MNARTLFLSIVFLFTAATLLPARADEASELMSASHQAYYYAADGGHARVEMTLVDKKGRTRAREFWMLRRDITDMGDQRYFIYFIKPADVMGTTFLVHKKVEGNDDRWLYLPSLDLVKRIATDDRGSSFMGSDFRYEDVSGRLPVLDNHEIIGAGQALDRPVAKVRSTPKDPKTADYAYRINWIDDATKLPLREECFDKNDVLFRVFEVGKLEDVEGIVTATERTMSNVKKGSRTLLTFSDLTYETKLEAKDFSERLLKNPPREYTR